MAEARRQRDLEFYGTANLTQTVVEEAAVKTVDATVVEAEPVEATVVETLPLPAEVKLPKRTRKPKAEQPAVVGEIKPAAPAPAEVPAATTAPAVVEAPAVNVVDLVKQHAKECGMVAAIAAINSTGAAKVTAIEPAKLPAFIERLQQELAAKASGK